MLTSTTQRRPRDLALLLLPALLLIILGNHGVASGYAPSNHPSQTSKLFGSGSPGILTRSRSAQTTLLHPHTFTTKERQLQDPNHVKLESILDLKKIPLPSEPATVPTASSVIDVDVAPVAPSAQATSSTTDKQDMFVASSAALAGFTDVLCLAKYGCFVNMMTGNLLKGVTALAQTGQACLVLPHLTMVFSYMIGVALCHHLQQQQQQQQSSVNSSVLSPRMAPIIAAIFVLGDLCPALAVHTLSMGFGLINTAASHTTGGTIFFALTGHLTRLTTYIHSNYVRIQQTHKLQLSEMDDATKKARRVLQYFLSGAFVASLFLQQSSKRLVATTTPFQLCTLLGLLYGSLFAWYTDTLHWRLPNRLVQGSQHLLARLPFLFGSSRSRFIPSPVVVSGPVSSM